jgi:hypothetical protein
MDANIGTNTAPNARYITRYVKEHYVQKKIRRDLYERLVKWCGESSVNSCLERALNILESNIAPNIVTNIGANIVPNTVQTQPTSNSDRGGEKQKTGHTWCRKRASIRNVEAFVKWVEKTYGLIDWWESEGEVCFETEKPAR